MSDAKRAADVTREVRATARVGVDTAMAGSVWVFEFATADCPVIDVAYVPGQYHDRLMAFIAGLMDAVAVSSDWRPTFDPETN